MTDNLPYDNHSTEFKAVLSDSLRHSTSLKWIDNKNLDTYRHLRMRRLFIPLFADNFSLLTIGDGRYGTDAIYFREYCQHVHASDLNVELLSYAKNNGLLDHFSAQNAEALSFEANSFDIVFAKEALHHCPIPFTALHEAYRVAKFAVACIEPYDQSSTILFNFRLLIKRLLRVGNRSGYNFEKVGNFVYNFVPKDFEKFLLGMHCRYIAYIGINDYHHSSLINCTYGSLDPRSLVAQFRFYFFLFLSRFLVLIRLKQPSLLGVILFKEKPSASLVAVLKFKGWIVKELPRNPYLR